MATFKPRLTKPEKGNPYYNTKANGGYSNAIKGKPTDPDCDVLSNCVGYAYGRFNEIGGWGSCKYLLPVNAENFIQYKYGLEVGQTPKLGACMVWRKGATLNGSDGAGHVAIVERVVSDTEVVVSESGWNSYAFRTKTRKKGTDGRWGAGAGYTFLGFIYNPAECCKATAEPAEPPKQETPKQQTKSVVATGAAHYFDSSLAGTYTVTEKIGLYMRHGAGYLKKKMVAIPWGYKVQCYGYYSKALGAKWLYVQITYMGVTYTGFMPLECLRK